MTTKNLLDLKESTDSMREWVENTINGYIGHRRRTNIFSMCVSFSTQNGSKLNDRLKIHSSNRTIKSTITISVTFN